jgi:hypothetical protein
MTNDITKAPKTSKLARQIALACYPEYKGRKIKVVSRETYYMENMWGGGSRNFAVAYDFATGNRSAALEVVGPEVKIPAGVAVVEHAYFCGKDCGITIYVNPAADKAGLLTEAA